MRILTAIFVLFMCMTIDVAAQLLDTIDVNHNSLNIKVLKPGREEYSVFSYGPQGTMTSLRIWSREISYIIKDGARFLVIHGQTDGADSVGRTASFSICMAENFKPIYHRTSRKKGPTSAYNFSDQGLAGADSVAGNSKIGFSLPASPLPFNWDLDMELVRTLPLDRKKKFAINWYQPGSKFKPEYYVHTVIGVKSIKTFDGRTTDCWLLQLDYSKDSYAIFYISQATRDLLKVEQYQNGTPVRFKIKHAAPVAH